ncbi:MAG: hypothetical protein WAK29_11030, partial [Terriglobales bacterium]
MDFEALKRMLPQATQFVPKRAPGCCSSRYLQKLPSEFRDQISSARKQCQFAGLSCLPWTVKS